MYRRSQRSKIKKEKETKGKEYRSLWKVDRVLAIHSLSSTDSQSSSNIPFPWHLLLGFNSQAQERQSFYNPSPGKENTILIAVGRD